MVGGSFNRHPWHEEVRIIVEDRTFPAMKHLPESIVVTDEIYQLDKYSRDTSDSREVGCSFVCLCHAPSALERPLGDHR